MNHLFIPFRLAVLAEEKLFNEQCLAWYNYGKLQIFGEDLILDCYATEENRPLAPLYQQIIDWFREKHNLYIEITMWHHGLHYSIKEIKKDSCYAIKNQEEYIEDYYSALTKAIEEAFKLIPQTISLAQTTNHTSDFFFQE